MTTFLEQPDQAAVDLKRRDEWRLTLDREVQMNTMQIEQMQQTVRHQQGKTLQQESRRSPALKIPRIRKQLR